MQTSKVAHAPKKTSMDTFKTGKAHKIKHAYGSNATVQTSRLPHGGCPKGSKAKSMVY